MTRPSVQDRVLLTADRTLMSDYHHNEFLGFGACAPSNVIPDWLYRLLFLPPIKTMEGIPVAAPYGLRKIEAQLLVEGFSVLTVDPNHLKRHAADVRVLGVHVMDPFGLGPASSTFAAVLKKEPFLAQHFRFLIGGIEQLRSEEPNLKIIMGGPGAWQFRYRKKFVEEHRIDCVISGEAEKAVGGLFRRALENRSLPQYYDVGIRDTPSLAEIPSIVNPAINGIVEIGRGCCRGCSFCSVTLRPLRWLPFERIIREIAVNSREEYSRVSILHAEDVMLYGSRTTVPNARKVVKLHELTARICEGVQWSHCSLAAIASNPRLFSRLAEIILENQRYWSAEVGIETGSPELVQNIMPAKAHPFDATRWPEIVRTGMGLMHESNLIPACTLIIGAPKEKPDDLVKTLELMDDLKEVRSLIVPLFFVPMGKLKDENWFKDTEISELHMALLKKCLEHDFYWIDELVKLAFLGKWYARLVRPLYQLFIGLAKRKVKRTDAHDDV